MDRQSGAWRCVGAGFGLDRTCDAFSLTNARTGSKVATSVLQQVGLNKVTAAREVSVRTSLKLSWVLEENYDRRPLSHQRAPAEQ